jgi:hypothetical protein
VSEMPSVYGCDQPKARKEHKCFECRGKISIGEKYHKHHGIWDGSAADYKVCDDCEALRKDADKDCSCVEDGTAFGELYETVFESREPEFIKRFMDIQRKRGSAIPDWMSKREAELTT